MTPDQVAVKLALRELVEAYALAVDTCDARGFGQLFTAAASLEIYEPGTELPVLRYTGTAQIESVIELVTGYAATFHVMANHQVVLQRSGQATGVTYCLAHHLAKDETCDTMMLIRYEDEYMLDNGSWRFARRRVMRQWNTTLAADRAPLAS